MTILNKIYGGAGCGKTYHLMKELEKLLLNDVDVTTVSMLTLTRAARREFIQRAMKITDSDEKKLRWFGTMHQLTWRMLGLSYKHNAITKKQKREFFNDYEKEPTGKLPNLIKINEVRRNCMQPNTKEGLLQTNRDTGLDFSYRNEYGRYEDLRIDEIIAFGSSWNEFMDFEDRYDYTKMIEVAHSSLNEGDLQPIFEFMMVDEFQDFSPLQHALYRSLSEQMFEVWYCGDDWQVIYGFAGASPEFLLNDPFTPGRELILPKTYRYGEVILENSLKYVRKLSHSKTRDITPADRESRVYSLHGSSWTGYIHDDDTKTAYLVRTNRQVLRIVAELEAKGLVYGLLGQSYSKIELLLKNYNTVATLHRGERAPIDDIGILIAALPVKPELTDAQVSLTGERTIKTMQLLKRGIKARMADPEYRLSLEKEFFTADDFASRFLESWSWGDIDFLSHIKDMSEFIKTKNLRFPDPLDLHINHMVGTIHKFKGNEADNVFLFRQMPYPISENVLYDERARDDERRVFYVGATRAKYNLYEVDDYFADFYNNTDPSVEEIL